VRRVSHIAISGDHTVRITQHVALASNHIVVSSPLSWYVDSDLSMLTEFAPSAPTTARGSLAFFRCCAVCRPRVAVTSSGSVVAAWCDRLALLGVRMRPAVAKRLSWTGRRSTVQIRRSAPPQPSFLPSSSEHPLSERCSILLYELISISGARFPFLVVVSSFHTPFCSTRRTVRQRCHR
jgi:hypothetical protein